MERRRGRARPAPNQRLGLRLLRLRSVPITLPHPRMRYITPAIRSTLHAVTARRKWRDGTNPVAGSTAESVSRRDPRPPDATPRSADTTRRWSVRRTHRTQSDVAA